MENESEIIIPSIFFLESFFSKCKNPSAFSHKFTVNTLKKCIKINVSQ